MNNSNFWTGKKVLITGNTGFKGSWLSLWLHKLGAKVYGYSLEPPTTPNLYDDCDIGGITETFIGDICNKELLKDFMERCTPQIIFHLAAQPIVRESYLFPVKTFTDNVIGTANVLDVAREIPSIRAIAVITTDKCYDNKEWDWGYRENDRLGGYDPYSASKACSEIVVQSFRNSFFNTSDYGKSHTVAIATARAGNVIGGGDWAKDRLIPDIMRSIKDKKKLIIRSPNAIRPWQHVLEPLSGYIRLAELLYDKGPEYGEAWNFGPEEESCKSVEWIGNYIFEIWSDFQGFELENCNLHEANFLKLDISKAKNRLNWKPKWDIRVTLQNVVEWYRAYDQSNDVSKLCLDQINQYELNHLES